MINASRTAHPEGDCTWSQTQGTDIWAECATNLQGWELSIRVSGCLGSPPLLRGTSPAALVSWAIACRASAVVLALQGHPEEAVHLRHLALTADRCALRLTANVNATQTVHAIAA